MKYQLKYEKRDKYLFVSVSGAKDSYSISYNYWKEILDLCSKMGYNKALIEENLKTQLSITDMFKVVDAISNIKLSKTIKCAFFDTQISHKSLNKFGENVAVNRGVLAIIFNNFNKAENWLIEDQI